MIVGGMIGGASWIVGIYLFVELTRHGWAPLHAAFVAIVSAVLTAAAVLIVGTWLVNRDNPRRRK